MLKQNLGQRMLQKLSPQQIQLMKLLQIPTATLDQRIQEELESNPALDESDDSDVYDLANEDGDEAYDDEMKSEDFELDDYLTEYIEDDPISYKTKTEAVQDVEEKTIPIAVNSTFHDHLEAQLGMLDLKSEEDYKIAQQIIGSIDKAYTDFKEYNVLRDSFLTEQTSLIVNGLQAKYNNSVKEAQIAEQKYALAKAESTQSILAISLVSLLFIGGVIYWFLNRQANTISALQTAEI